jgi:hypothetical protein
MELTPEEVVRKVLGIEPGDPDIQELREVFWTKPVGSAILKTLVTRLAHKTC